VHAVIETDAYDRAADNAGVSEDERLAIVSALATNPTIGDMIEGTGGARKWRFAGRGKGKRGGYRIITYFAADDVPVFLLDIYAKGEKIDLTAREKSEIKNHLKDLADDYRASARRKVSTLTGRAR
jgi:hypothetical protein